MLPFPSEDSTVAATAAASNQVHRHRSTAHLHRTRPYYPQHTPTRISFSFYDFL